MKKTLVSLSLLAALSLGLSACGVSVSTDAASVGSVGISQATLNASLHDATSSAPFACLLAEGSTVTKGAGVKGTYAVGFTAQQLSLLIDHAVIAGELSKLHLAATPLATTLVQEQVASGLTDPSGGTCTATGAQVLASFPASYRNLLLTSQLDDDLLSAHLAGTTLTDAGIAAYTKQHPNETELACVSAILVASSTTASSIATQLKGGASFATLAKADSTDSTSAAAGGSLGCYYPGEFSGALGTAVAGLAIDQPSAPISFSSQWVILEVTQRKAGTPAGAALALVSGETATEEHYATELSTRDKIWVNSQYGHWGSASGQDQVIPPTGPVNANTTNSNNLTPVGATYK